MNSRYKLEAQGDGWIAKPVSRDRVSSSSLFYCVLEDPFLAVEKFNQELLDKTPESCLPLNYLEPNGRYMKERASDLFGYISFSREFSSKVSVQAKEAIFSAITSMIFPEYFEERWNFVKYEGNNMDRKSHSVDMPELKFSFDNIYPNKILCEKISKHLRKIFIKTELVGNDYGTEPEGWDLRFHIVHFYGLPEYWRAEFCRISGAKYSCQKVGDKYVAKDVGGELNSFPVCNIPLRYLERSDWLQHDKK